VVFFLAFVLFVCLRFTAFGLPFDIFKILLQELQMSKELLELIVGSLF